MNIRFSKYIAGFLLLSSLLGACKKDSQFKHQAGTAMTIDSFTPSSGGRSTQILINGSNFTADLSEISVSINGKNLPVVGVNGNQIMVVVPKKCGSGKLTVKIGSDVTESSTEFKYFFTNTVTTFAGSGVAGFANGKGEEAQFNFNSPTWYRSSGIAVDKDLNVYVADPGNACIRKIDSTGMVSTLAGSPGNTGNVEGQGASARFYLPYSLTLDNDANVYVADVLNWNVRKITPQGYASWYFGAPAEPWALAYDKKNNILYMSCTNAGAIYKSTAAWSYELATSGLTYAAGLDVDTDGNLIVTGHGDHTIFKLTAGSWAKTPIAGQINSGGYLNGPGASAKFYYPWSLALDSRNNIYVATNGTTDGLTSAPDQSIRFIDATSHEVSTFAGSGSAGYLNGIGEAAAFSAPTGVCVDKNGTVYVMDKNNNRIRKIVSE